MSADLIFNHEHKAIKFDIQNKPHLSSLLLLAAFLKHSDDLYEQSGVQVEFWPVWGWLYSSVVLNKDLYYKFPFILASFETWTPLNLA